MLRVLVLISLLPLAEPLAAQQLAELATGDSIRIAVEGSDQRRVERVQEVRGDTLFLGTPETTQAQLLSELAVVEVRGLDRWSGGLQGVGIGAGLGFLGISAGLGFLGISAGLGFLGISTLFYLNDGGGDCGNCDIFQESLAWGLYFGAIPGGLVCGLLGAMIGAEEWRVVFDRR